MLLEKVKFLEEAIRTAREEVFDNILSLKENVESIAGEKGGEAIGKDILEIKAILDDLLGTAEHFETYQIEGAEEFTKRHETGKYEDHTLSYKYETGDKVIARTFYTRNPEFYEAYGFNSDEEFGTGSEHIKYQKLLILERGPKFRSTHGPSYLTEQNGKLFIIDEQDIE